MVRLDEAEIVEKGRVGPGQMIASIWPMAASTSDARSRTISPAAAALRRLGREYHHLDSLIAATPGEPILDRDELRRRQVAVGSRWRTRADPHPMVEEAKEAVGSMGDDTPIAVLSEQYRGLHHFLPAEFSQVTNPPIDSPLREARVMTPEDPARQSRQHPRRGRGPVRAAAARIAGAADRRVRGDARLYGRQRGATIDCTFDPADGEHALRERSSASAGGRGRRARRLRACDPDRRECRARARADPDDPRDRRGAHAPRAPAAAHLHLAQRALGECLDVHYFAVLIGVGATTVNAYLAEEPRSPTGTPRPVRRARALEDCLARYKKAVDEGLLKIMSKMGISVISSYRGGYNFEAVGLSRTLVAEYFPGMPSASPASAWRASSRRSSSCTPAPSTRRSWPCRSAASTATAAAARPMPGRQGSSTPCSRRSPRHSYQTYKRFSDGVAGPAAGHRCATCSTSATSAKRCRSTRSSRSPRSASAS
jgi:glutamate synthase (NADPH) large chain